MEAGGSATVPLPRSLVSAAAGATERLVSRAAASAVSAICLEVFAGILGGVFEGISFDVSFEGMEFEVGFEAGTHENVQGTGDAGITAVRSRCHDPPRRSDDGAPRRSGAPESGDTGAMKLSRPVSWFLLAFGVWSWFIWITFVKNLWRDASGLAFDDAGDPTGYFWVHLLLAVTSFLLGTAIGVIGLRGLRALRRESPHDGRGSRGDQEDQAEQGVQR
jgi:hypothetical protein